MSGAGEDNAIPLITLDDDGKFVLHEEAMDFVSYMARAQRAICESFWLLGVA